MSKQINRDSEGVPVTEVKQYTFGSEQDVSQIKKPQKKTDKKTSKPRNKQNNLQKTKKDNLQKNKKDNLQNNKQHSKQQNFKQAKRKNKRRVSKKMPVIVLKTADDVRQDNQRLEKEILLDIKEIRRIEI